MTSSIAREFAENEAKVIQHLRNVNQNLRNLPNQDTFIQNLIEANDKELSKHVQTAALLACVALLEN